jgi:hypothetical protein
MFVQVIKGKVADQDGFRRQLDRWRDELAPGATGWLGTTTGVAADGRSVTFARFESADAARANSDRPEQGQWWAETEKVFDGGPTFEESEDVQEWLGGGSDDAGFVQFMSGTVKDRARMSAIDEAFTSRADQLRPDVLGGVRVWLGDDRYTEAVYFTSEADARANEGKELPPDVQEVFAELGDLMGEVDYTDIGTPLLFSPKPS